MTPICNSHKSGFESSSSCSIPQIAQWLSAKESVYIQGMALLEEVSTALPTPYTKKIGIIHFHSCSQSCPAYPMSLSGLCRCFIQKSLMTWRQGSSLLGAIIFFLQIVCSVSRNILTSDTILFLSEELWTLKSMVSTLCHRQNGIETQFIAKGGTSIL